MGFGPWDGREPRRFVGTLLLLLFVAGLRMAICMILPHQDTDVCHLCLLRSRRLQAGIGILSPRALEQDFSNILSVLNEAMRVGCFRERKNLPDVRPNLALVIEAEERP